MAWKCQLAPGTAREQVRVARALRCLPVLSAELAAGRTSYAKVRALTRIASPATEADLSGLSAPITASPLERFTAAHRGLTRADDEHAAMTRRLTWRQDDDGSLAITVRLPPADSAVVLQALRAAAGELNHEHDPSHDTVPGAAGVSAETSAPGAAGASEAAGAAGAAGKLTVTPACLADALTDIAGSFLAHKGASAANADLYRVIVHVGAEALAGVSAEAPPDSTRSPGDVSAETVPAGSAGDCPAGHPAGPARCHIEHGPAICPDTAGVIACLATVSWMVHGSHGGLLDAGRRRRAPTAALRRAVRGRTPIPASPHCPKSAATSPLPWCRDQQ